MGPVIVLALLGALTCMASQALGVEVEGGCLDVSTWGVWGQAAAGIMGALAALRPVSEALLAASAFLGPRAMLLARVLYGLGRASGMICISKPQFAKNYAPPSARIADGENDKHGG